MDTLVFPVVYSVLSGQALVSQVLSQYELEEIKACRFWHRGLSDVYLVETQTHQYILRVSHCHWRTKSEVDFELELLDFLKQRYLPVAYPLKTRAGGLSIEIQAPEGKRYVALFVYAPGGVALGDLNVEQSCRLGETVAKIHDQSRLFRPHASRPPLTLQYLLEDSFQAIAPFLQTKPADLHFLTEAVIQLQAQLHDFPQEPPFWGICWGDPHSGNVHFTAENQLTLFDFDQCGYGWRIFDIAKFLQVSLNSGLNAKVRSAFIDGYQSVTPLMPFEVASLQAFTEVAHLWAWAICLNSASFYDYSRLDDSYFHHRLAHLKMLRSPEWQLF